jgi:glycosyltransferase involved in cell wall biosynthesis
MEHDLRSEKMNPVGILMVLPWELGPIGGVNTVVANLYERFLFHGALKPFILIQNWANTKPLFVLENGYSKIRMRIRGPVSHKSILWSLLTYLLSLPRELLKLTRLVRTLNVSVVNAHYPTLTMLNFVLARRLRLLNARLLISIHGTDVENAKSRSFIEKMMWRWLLLEADAIVPCSDGLAGTVIDFEPRIYSRVFVVHNGLNFDRFIAKTKADHAFPRQLTDHRIILSVGAYEYKKGHDILLKAFNGLAKGYSDLHLVVIGQSGPASAEVESLVDELHLGERCTLLKDVPNEIVASYMGLANLFVLASRSEPFGLVLLEAGAFGVPIVATRVGGIPEIIGGPEYGVLVTPDDIESLESAMENLLQDTEMARKMGFNFQERVRKVFSWEEAYRKYRRVLEKVCAEFDGELQDPTQQDLNEKESAGYV